MPGVAPPGGGMPAAGGCMPAVGGCICTPMGIAAIVGITAATPITPGGAVTPMTPDGGQPVIAAPSPEVVAPKLAPGGGIITPA
eukprot:258119-Prymnesium_polylepis.1